MRLIILGAGGYGKTVYDVASQMEIYESIAFLDDNSNGVGIIGKCCDFEGFIDDDTQIYPAFGNNTGRLEWIDRILKKDGSVPTIVHPSAYVSPTASIGVGTVVLPKAVINTDTQIQKGVIVNCGAIIDHGCIIEDGVHICLGAVVKAENRIPSGMKVEAGEVIENRKFPL